MFFTSATYFLVKKNRLEYKVTFAQEMLHKERVIFLCLASLQCAGNEIERIELGT